MSAEWSNATQRYRFELESVRTGERTTEEAEVMIYAIGGFQAPLYPKDIPGKEDFKGELFHSACWRHDVILKKKRVGVIGNGCSSYVSFPSDLLECLHSYVRSFWCSQGPIYPSNNGGSDRGTGQLLPDASVVCAKGRYMSPSVSKNLL